MGRYDRRHQHDDRGDCPDTHRRPPFDGSDHGASENRTLPWRHASIAQSLPSNYGFRLVRWSFSLSPLAGRGRRKTQHEILRLGDRLQLAEPLLELAADHLVAV